MLQELLSRMFLIVAVLTAGPLVAGSIVGLIVSVIQASTQLQEQTISFILRLSTLVVVSAILAPWGGEQIVLFTQEVLMSLAVPE